MQLYLYRIRYRDNDPGCPVFTMRLRAYSREHAEERFWESDPDDDDWELISIDRERTIT